MATTLEYSCHVLEEDQDHQCHYQEEDPFEAEETLSLCDLPTHCDSANSDYFSKEYQSSSYDQDEDTFFEFFSEEFTASTYPSGNKDIIFCGKLLPHNKEAPRDVAAEKKTQRSTETSNKSCTKKKWGFFRWRRFRRSKSKKIVSHSLKRAQVKDSRSTSNATKTISSPTSKGYRRCNLSVGKVSILSSNRSKSKWYLLMFGMTSFPTEMELGDIKARQSRRMPSTMFGATSEASNNELKGKGDSKDISSNSSKSKWLWGLLRAIGCSSRQPNAITRAAFV